MTAICRTCGAQIIWAVTAASLRTRRRKLIPLDVADDSPGNIVISGETSDARPVAEVVAAGKGTRISHFVTCPNADQHRSKREV